MQLARSRIGQFLPLCADGYACTTEQLLDVLVAVSVGKETIEQVSADLKIKVGAETIRGYFNEQLKVENLFELQESVNCALQASWQPHLKSQKLEVAIDFHDQISRVPNTARKKLKWRCSGIYDHHEKR